MTDYTLAVNTDTEELARLIAESGPAAALNFVKELDSEVGEWAFTKAIKKWAKDEIKEALREGWTA